MLDRLLPIGIGLDQISPEVASDEDRTHGFALVQSVHAVAVGIGPVTGHAIGGDADGFQEYAVAVPRITLNMGTRPGVQVGTSPVEYADRCRRSPFS